MLPGGPDISGRPRVLIVGARNPEHEALGKSANAARWELTLCETAELAGLLERGRFDFVISADTETLELCLRLQPLAVRVRILPKGAGFPTVRDSVHSCVAGPLDAATLEAVIDSARGGAGLITLGRLRGILGTAGRLPVLPAAVTELLRVAEDTEASLADMAAVIQRDAALSAGVLRVANSAYYGLSRRVATVHQAATMLGSTTIRSIALAGQAWELAQGAHERDVAPLRASSLLAGQVARHLAGPHTAEVATAAMLANVGALLALGRLPDEYRRVRASVAETGSDSSLVEAEIIGANFAQLGAMLLSLWKLPLTTCEAVAFSQTFPHPRRGRDVRALTYLSCKLAAEAAGGPGLDPGWCTAMGLDRDLPKFRAVAAQLHMAWPNA